MPVTTILDNTYVNLLYYPEHKIVYHTFRQPLSGQKFRDVLNLGTQVLRENGADKWLSDDRQNMGGLTPDDNTWGVEVWFPQTKAAGWKYWALVVPPGTEARMSMVEAVQNFSGQGVLTRLFGDSEQAMVWLNSL